jgi:energy-coupling factor transport system ATP-binding protein
MIEVRGLGYRYPRSTSNALEEIDLEFHESSFTAIMGANGSGKSTLARCLNGLIKPAAGRVCVDGLDTHDDSRLSQIRQRVGMIFQDPNLQMTSVTVERELAFGLENIRVEPAEMHRRVERQLALFGLEKYRHVSPSNLAGGEKQRLAIAAVLLLEPRYLILDEATSLLSTATRKSVLDLVAGLREIHRIGVILITQFPQEAMRAERLIVLHAGHAAFDAPPPEVFTHGDELSAFGVPLPIRSDLEKMYELSARQP